jgi:zinc ribbon protein
MSSATSTESFRPWQFFLLAGMLAATASVIVATGQSPAAIVLLSITVIAASFVGLAVYRSLAPLVSPESTPAPTLIGGRTRAALEREKSLALRSIKELEFDYAMKKVAKADYEEMNTRLRARALRLMRQLEAGESYRSDIEKEVAKRVGAATLDGEASGFSRGAAGRCRSCNTTNDADARFCKQCGSKLEAASAGTKMEAAG